MKELNATELASIESKKNNDDIVVGGIIVQARPMRSKRGARWTILILQDRTGVIEALVFPEAFQKLEGILKTNTPLLVKGRVAIEDVGTRLRGFRCSRARSAHVAIGSDAARMRFARPLRPRLGGPFAQLVYREARAMPGFLRFRKLGRFFRYA